MSEPEARASGKSGIECKVQSAKCKMKKVFLFCILHFAFCVFSALADARASDGADSGKTVYYLLRWQSKNGDKGDWSDVAQATVNG
jgi:hypothetical protein